MSKARAQTRHARVRALQRYGIELGPAGRAEIIRAIQGGRSTVVERQSRRVTVHDVELEGGVVRVVYDRQRKTLVTFLPSDEPVSRITW